MASNFILKHFLEGVWGPKAHQNNLQNGGPECAAQSTFDFKIKTNLIMVSDVTCSTLSATISYVRTCICLVCSES